MTVYVRHRGHDYLILWVDGHPEGVDAEGQLRNIQPLAVDVVVVDVLAARRDALVPVVLAVVLGVDTGAVVVLQAEGGLVTLGHADTVRVQQVEVSEDLPDGGV